MALSGGRAKKARHLRTPALILRTRAYGESDRIVTVLSRDHGKFSGIAKGAARSRKRFGGALEPLTAVLLDFRHRPGAELAFLESAEVIRAPRGIPRDLDRYAFASYVQDLLDAFVEGREADAAFFDLADRVVEVVDREPLDAAHLRQFEVHLLEQLGFLPRWNECAACHRGVDAAEAPLWLDPVRGDLRCATCSGPHGIEVAASTIAAVETLRRAPMGALPATPAAEAGPARVLLQSCLLPHARRPLKAAETLRGTLFV